MAAPLSPEGLDLIFRKARTYNGYTDQPVTEAQLHEIWDLMKMGPTKEKNDVQSSWAGVLIGPVWESCAWSLMVSSGVAKRCREGRNGGSPDGGQTTRDYRQRPIARGLRRPLQRPGV